MEMLVEAGLKERYSTGIPGGELQTDNCIGWCISVKTPFRLNLANTINEFTHAIGNGKQ